MKQLEFAIQMEKDGARYYGEQAKRFKGQAVEQAFLMLVDAENQHATLLEGFRDGTEPKQPSQDATDWDNLFTDAADFSADPGFLPEQLDVYTAAMDMEKKSVALYSSLKENVEDGPERDLLEFLISEEERHQRLFEELTEMLQKPKDWVEDAEFGAREEY